MNYFATPMVLNFPQILSITLSSRSLYTHIHTIDKISNLFAIYELIKYITVTSDRSNEINNLFYISSAFIYSISNRYLRIQIPTPNCFTDFYLLIVHNQNQIPLIKGNTSKVSMCSLLPHCYSVGQERRTVDIASMYE